MDTAFPQKTTCSHFYKYSSTQHLDRLKTIILEHKLYVPSVAELNDPVDGRPKLAPLSEDQLVAFLYDDFVRRHPNLPPETLQNEQDIIRYNAQHHGAEKLSRVLSEILNREMEGFRIYSMSKRFDNRSLWVKYAGGHSGYCLEFANEGPLFENTVEVVYGDCAPMDVTDKQNRSARFLAHKHPDWSNEEEIRLIRARGSGSTVVIAPHWLRRVILGKDMPEDNRTLIRGWAKQRQPELIVVTAYLDRFLQEIRLFP